RRRLTDYLASVQAKFRDYEELKVVDPSGRVLFTSARQAGTAVPTEWLAAARAEAAVLGEPHWDEAHRKGVLLVAVPITDAGRHVLGLMVGTINLSSLQEILRSWSVG